MNNNTPLTAKYFIEELSKLVSDNELDKLEKFFKGNDGCTLALGVRFGDIFTLAKVFTYMPLAEIDELLNSDFYEVRMGAASIMDYQARSKKTPDTLKKKLFDLYINRHNRLNNWDFVDRAAPQVIGQFLIDKPRDILYKLTNSKDVWERRTAIVSTYAFIKQNELDDTFRIAEILVNDKEELINKAVGSWIREAGKRDTDRLKLFLDKHAATMPRVTLRYAIENFDKVTKNYYLRHKE